MVFDISENIYSPKTNNHIKWTVGGGINCYDSKHYGDVIWLETVGELEEFYRWYNNNAQKLQANIYGKVEYIIKERILIYGDLQYRYITYNVEGADDNFRDLTHRYTWNNFLNPKVGANFFLDKKKCHSLYASFATSHREPSRSDLVDAPADRLPKAETLYDTELGYTLHIKKFAFNANAYYMNYKDQLVLTGELNDVGDAMMTNVDKSFRAGLELVASYRPCRFFLWRINGSYSVNKINNYINYIIDYDTYTYIEENLGTTNISFSPNLVAGNEFVFTPFRNFDISWQNKFIGKQYLDNTSNEDFILKPYILGSLQFNYGFEIGKMPKIGLFLSINNLYNQKYESNGALYQYISEGKRYYEDYYNPQAGINFMTGISIKF
jgi:iron complex outermembrane receptor protein